jgi:hypothetical protein
MIRLGNNYNTAITNDELYDDRNLFIGTGHGKLPAYMLETKPEQF